MQRPAIESTDLLLLSRLQQNATPDLAALARDLGMPEQILKQRLQFFEQQGWLRGFFLTLSPKPLGLDVTAFVFLYCKDSSLLDEVSALALMEDSIQECHAMSGEWTHLLKIRTPNLTTLEGFLRRLQEWPGIQRTQCQIALATSKETSLLPLSQEASKKPTPSKTPEPPTKGAPQPSSQQHTTPPTPSTTRSLAAESSSRPSATSPKTPTSRQEQPQSVASSAPPSAAPTAPLARSSAQLPAVPAPPVSRSSAQLPALPPLSVSTNALPPLPPLSSPQQTPPAMLAALPPSQPEPLALKENQDAALDPVLSVSAAVDILLPSIDVDILSSPSLSTPSITPSQSALSSPSAPSTSQTSLPSAPSTSQTSLLSVPSKEPEKAVGEQAEEKAEDPKAVTDRLAALKRKRQLAQEGLLPPSASASSSQAALEHVKTAVAVEAVRPPVDTTKTRVVAAAKSDLDATQVGSAPSASSEPRATERAISGASVESAAFRVDGTEFAEHSLESQIAALPSAHPSAEEDEPATLVSRLASPSKAKADAESPSETRQDLPSVDSTHPGLRVEALVDRYWLNRTLSDEEKQDSDPAFEELVETLETEELQMFEVLSTVKRMFWSPLRDLARGCSNENIIAFLHSVDVAPIRMAIRETAQEVVEAMADIYAQKLDEIADERNLDASIRVQYILDSERRERILGDIRNPFREFVERLERLDQARDEVLMLLNDQISAQLNKQRIMLSPSLLEYTQRVEEARGIEGAWQLWCDALKQGMALYTEEAPEETEQLLQSMEQFISQFEPTYGAILNRILEIWTDKLIPPLEALRSSAS